MYVCIFIASASLNEAIAKRDFARLCLSHWVCWIRWNRGQITSIYKCQLGSISAQFMKARVSLTHSFYFLFSYSFHNLNLWPTKNFHFRATAQNFIESHITYCWRFTCSNSGDSHWNAIEHAIWNKYSFDRNGHIHRILLCNFRIQKSNWFRLSSSFSIHFA